MSDLSALWKSRVGAILGIVRTGGTKHREIANMRVANVRDDSQIADVIIDPFGLYGDGQVAVVTRVPFPAL